MIGVNAQNGKALGGLDHLRQSITTILSTPIGTRVMRRDFGSRLFELIDKPLNRSATMDLINATTEALGRWEQRLRLIRVLVASSAPGTVSLNLTGEYLLDGKVVQIDGVEVYLWR